jgi:spermidine/putrescine transport system permease protein
MSDSLSVAPTRPAPVQRRTGASPAVMPALLGMPVVAWQLLFFAIPLAFLLVISFWQVRSFRLEPAFVFDNWSRVIASGTFASALVHTLIISSLCTVLTLVIAFPAAYTLAFRVSPRLRNWAITLLIVPVFSSYMLRIYAWQIVLSPQGLANALIGKLGFDPWALLGGGLSLQIGLLTLTLPIAVLILVFAMTGIDSALIEAAENLGARRRRVIENVIIPAIRPALALAATTTFLLAFGDYVSPVFMTGSKPPTLSILLVDTVKSGSQWPRGSVVGVSMLLILTLVFVLGRRLSTRRRGQWKHAA